MLYTTALHMHILQPFERNLHDIFDTFPNYTLVITATRFHNQYVIARAASHFTIKDFKRVEALTAVIILA